METVNNYLTPNFSFAPILPHRALGSRVWDNYGKEYIDLAGGIAVNALGHCNPELIKVLVEQANKLWHISNLYTTEPAQSLACKLVTNSFADKVFFANSGAEANEAALKLARKHARDYFGEAKHEIVACTNSFHGRTLFTVSVGGQPKYSQDFAPLPSGIKHVPFNNLNALEDTINENTCAFIVEPIQGESGVLPATAEYLHKARELCDKFDAALIFDEVQTGIGRTGKLFAHEHYDVMPDILSSAKALGCGIPIGAMLCTDKFAESFTVGSHGSTFGGNPLACAVGSRAFDLISLPETLNNVVNQGNVLQSQLAKLGQESGVFSEVRGLGLLIGCVLSEKYKGRAGELVKISLSEGLMVLQAGANVLRLAPSLLLNDDDLNEGMLRLQRAIRVFANS
ncbi:MAG: acetylornithine/succinyldiaminopimelate transaminase [Neisseriaceae bacterium]|nr:acetylornithine/succinyldiaminopimelate transaminase [Neisseriaceae bacterium]